MSALQLARAGYGGWLIVRGDRVDKVAGGRYLLQALTAVPFARHRTVHRLAAAVDALHALSMYALAVTDLRPRRVSLGDALGASVFALAESIAAAATSAGAAEQEARWRGPRSVPRGGRTG